MCLPPLTLQSGWLTGQGCALDPYILADIQGKVKGFSETFVICYPERRVPALQFKRGVRSTPRLNGYLLFLTFIE